MGYIVEQHAQGKAQLAFIGDRNAIWHRLGGNQMLPGQSVEDWAKGVWRSRHCLHCALTGRDQRSV